MYEKLIEWAAAHNMMFKVNVTKKTVGHSAEVWMCDKVDGFTGAECCDVHPDGSVSWLGFRFRLKKNEQFIDKFVDKFLSEVTPIGTDDWVGYDDTPKFTLPTYWKSNNGKWEGVKGTFYWLDKLTDEKRDELEGAGCTLLKSHPEYAPEIINDVAFIPNGVRFAYC